MSRRRVIAARAPVALRYALDVLRAPWILSPLFLLAAACVGDALAPSIWPPSNFSLDVEESRQQGAAIHVVRRLRVDASGVVIYATSSQPLEDPNGSISLPVFDRMSIYRLEPAAVRALSRKLDRLGVSELAVGEGGASGEVDLVLRWRAFSEQRVLACVGRPRAGLADVLALAAAHLPPGESFETPIGRPVAPVLRGVPTPREDAAGALAAICEVLIERSDDRELLLVAFGLAARLGRSADAEDFLQRWQAALEAEVGDSPFATDLRNSPSAQAEAYRKLIPGRG